MTVQCILRDEATDAPFIPNQFEVLYAGDSYTAPNAGTLQGVADAWAAKFNLDIEEGRRRGQEPITEAITVQVRGFGKAGAKVFLNSIWEDVTITLG